MVMLKFPRFLFVAAITACSTIIQAAPSFRNEVLPVLSKAGCNTGGCHGALAGKGGFRLSLFGYNPEADYLSIVAHDGLDDRLPG